jgi:hypothetical protein
MGAWYYGLPQYGPPRVDLTATLPQNTSAKEQEELCVDILAILPQESVIYLEMDISIDTTKVIATMPNIESLSLGGTVVRKGFLLPNQHGPDAHKKLLPSLKWLRLGDVGAEDDDWEPLITYLTHQTSGNQAISLSMYGEGVHVCSEVVERIGDLVEEFNYEPDLDKECPFGYCSDEL